MASQPKATCTPDEYLELERKAEFKSEYIDGYIVAMVGASEPHNLIVTNVVRELSTQVKDHDCRVYSNDMRVDLREQKLFAYPDVLVVCGEPQLAGKRRDNLRNPLVIIEVLSQSTESYDRGVKFIKYRRIESLKEYVLVAQDSTLVEHYVRQPNGDWLMSEAIGMDAMVRLDSIGCELQLIEVYDKVQFTA
ncbi:MAG TPA: Uma2 family endonuclease [Blastocatellia bacterium]|nr:Uma2 family endonuclease [Blastocatellia bacterium]